jgi:hypothetical protein
LGQNNNATKTRVHQVRKSEVNKAVATAEGDRRLSAIGTQGHQAFAFTACQHHPEYSQSVHNQDVRAVSGIHVLWR